MRQASHCFLFFKVLDQGWVCFGFYTGWSVLVEVVLDKRAFLFSVCLYNSERVTAQIYAFMPMVFKVLLGLHTSKVRGIPYIYP